MKGPKVCFCGDVDCSFDPPKKIDGEREVENEELRYLSEDEVNDEELVRYKRFGVG